MSNHVNMNTYWGNDGGTDVILGTLTRQSLCESDETHLRGTVVSLPEVTYANMSTPGIHP